MEDADAPLVRRAGQGDQEAFAQLVRRHQRYLFNLAFRLVGDYGEAEDLTQEAFLRAWRGLPAFRGRAKFTTWLYRIVFNLCANRLGALRPGLLDEAELDLNVAVSQDWNPAQAYDEQERREFLHRQIEALPEKYRLVITLYHLQGFSYEEMAEVLGLPLGTVKSHLFRARALLKERLEKCRYDL